MNGLFSFPNPVNEVAARVVAAGVVLLSAAYLITGNVWVLALLAYGFLARVATGPTLSPLGLVASRWIAPRITAPRPVPGPPKRFAQAIGATFTVAALVAHLLGAGTVAFVLVAVITVFATLEAGLGFCMGCTVFGWLTRAGLVPEPICVACEQVRARYAS